MCLTTSLRTPFLSLQVQIYCVTCRRYMHSDYVYKLQCHVHSQVREQSNSAKSRKSCRRLQFVQRTCFHATRKDGPGCQVTSLRRLVLLRAISQSQLPLYRKHTVNTFTKSNDNHLTAKIKQCILQVLHIGN